MRFSATSVDISEFSEDIAISNSEKHLILETVRLFEKLARYDDLEIRENGPKGQQLNGWRGQVTAVEAWIRGQCRPKYDLNSDDGYLSYQRACVATKKRIFKGLEKVDDSFLTDPALRGRVDSIIEFFKINLNQVFATDQNNVNGNYRQRVSIRSNDDNRIQCDPSEYVKKAHTLLSECADGTVATPQWPNVSCALALVTGRRQTEIHWSATFERISDYEVVFTGQLKGKGREDSALIDKPFDIPTLVKADLVIAGLDWLTQKGKRIERVNGNAAMANKRYCPRLNEFAKEQWKIVSDEQWKQVDPRDKWTYHKLRCIYFMSQMKNEDRSFSSAIRRAPQILGDNDITAIEPYERVEIVDEAVTQI